MKTAALDLGQAAVDGIGVLMLEHALVHEKQ